MLLDLANPRLRLVIGFIRRHSGIRTLLRICNRSDLQRNHKVRLFFRCLWPAIDCDITGLLLDLAKARLKLVIGFITRGTVRLER